MRRGLLLDLDDTLYDYAPAEAIARENLFKTLEGALSLDAPALQQAWTEARKKVKARVGARGCAHSRLLYLSELLHDTGLTRLLPLVRTWERSFWKDLLAAAPLRPGALNVLQSWKQQGGKIAIVTDLTLEVQLWKLEHYGLAPWVDALVASEEVPFDKPAIETGLLALERLDLPATACVMIGDGLHSDAPLAAALKIPFLQACSTSHPETGGLTWPQIGKELGL